MIDSIFVVSPFMPNLINIKLTKKVWMGGGATKLLVGPSCGPAVAKIRQNLCGVLSVCSGGYIRQITDTGALEQRSGRFLYYIFLYS